MSSQPQRWIVRIGQRESKPLSSLQLRQLAAAGKVLPATLGRVGSSERWVAARQVRSLLGAPAPEPRGAA